MRMCCMCMRLILSPKDDLNMSEAILAVLRVHACHIISLVFFSNFAMPAPASPHSTSDTFAYANHRAEHTQSHLACRTSSVRIVRIRMPSRFLYLCYALILGQAFLVNAPRRVGGGGGRLDVAMINYHLIKLIEATACRLVRAVQLLLLLIHSPLLTHMGSVCYKVHFYRQASTTYWRVRV